MKRYTDWSFVMSLLVAIKICTRPGTREIKPRHMRKSGSWPETAVPVLPTH